MLLSRHQIGNLDESSLRAFLERKAAEGQYLDYKVALSGDNERQQRREFLKDVTGFANALGGDIIIGAKEPADDQGIDDQLAGIVDGDSISSALENVVRDSTEPRVPGLLVHPIKLASGRWVIVVHVPASVARPHMVNFGGLRTFYIRRGRSTVPMTVQELRESALSAATAEGKARETFALRRADAIRYFSGKAPILFLQAAPLVAPEAPWAVDDQTMLHVVRGSDRIHRYHSHGIATEYTPRITLEGVLATNNPEEPYWIWEVHRNGYVSILIRLHLTKLESLGGDFILLHAGFHDPFFVLAELLDQLWRITGFDAPYAFASELTPARPSIFKWSATYMEYSTPYLRDEIVWPIYMRQPGQDPRTIARSQIVDLYHAYGLSPPKNIEPPT